MITLKNGDILIKLGQIPQVGRDYSTLVEQARHVMVYNNKKAYHAFVGKEFEGVGSQGLLKNVDIHEGMGVGLVLHIPNDGLRKNLAEVVQRLDIVLSPEEIKKSKEEPKYAGKKPISLRTPYSIIREKDDSSIAPQHEIYRAFRAAFRSYPAKDAKEPSSEAQPFSKKKGISCNEFVAYALKAAIVKQLFPNGVPEKIMRKFNAIQYLKDAGKDAEEGKDKITKLKQLDNNHFKEFEKIVREEIDTCQHLAADLRKEYLDFLLAPVKGIDIKDFCKLLQKFPKICQFSGYLVYLEEEWSVFKPCVVDQSEFERLRSNDNTAMVVRPRDLEFCSIELSDSDPTGGIEYSMS